MFRFPTHRLSLKTVLRVAPQYEKLCMSFNLVQDGFNQHIRDPAPSTSNNCASKPWETCKHLFRIFLATTLIFVHA